MTKGLKYIGDKDGVQQFIEYEVEEQLIQEIIVYDSKVVELIREKYSLDDEFALNSKSMQIFLNNCTDEQRAKWIIEIEEFTNYRQQCIANVRAMCNITE